MAHVKNTSGLRLRKVIRESLKKKKRGLKVRKKTGQQRGSEELNADVSLSKNYGEGYFKPLTTPRRKLRND